MSQPLSHHLVVPWNHPKKQTATPAWHKLHTRKQRRQHQQYLSYVKYGVGIAAGVSVVGWLKRKIKQLPVVGLLASPFLSLMPTVLLGTAVGAAVVYGIDEGDPMAAQKKVLPKVKQHMEAAHRDVAAVAADLHRGVQRNMVELQGQSNEVMRDLSRTLDAAETTLAPIALRHAEQAQKQLKQLEHHWREAAADLQQQQQQQQQQRSSGSGSQRRSQGRARRGQQVPHSGAGSSEEEGFGW